MSFQPFSQSNPRDFFIEVAKGNVQGHKVVTVSGRDLSVGSIEKDLWVGSTNFIWPTSAESWEIVSDNTNDSFGGTGANAILLTVLDSDYNEQEELVILNGTTPVTLVGSYIRLQSMLVVSAGSSESNEGQIELRVTSGGNPRGYILPNVGESQDSFFTVPANTSAYLISALPFWPKDRDGNLIVSFRPFMPPNPPVIQALNFPFYQSGIEIIIRAPAMIGEKSDLWLKAKASNEGTEISLIYSILLVENT